MNNTKTIKIEMVDMNLSLRETINKLSKFSDKGMDCWIQGNGDSTISLFCEGKQ